MFPKIQRTINTNTNFVPDEDGNVFMCGHTLNQFHQNTFVGELIVPKDAIPIHVKEGNEIEVITKLIKGRKGNFDGQEIFTYAFYDNILNTIAIVRLKETASANVMFIVEQRTEYQIGIYGRMAEETIVPEPKMSDRPSYSCFKGFGEYGDYVGIVVEAFKYNSISLTGYTPIEKEMAIVLEIPAEMTHLAGDWGIIQYTSENVCSCNWVIPLHKAEELLAIIVQNLKITFEELYSLKCKTSDFVCGDVGDGKKVYPRTSYGIDRLYKAYEKPQNLIICY